MASVSRLAFAHQLFLPPIRYMSGTVTDLPCGRYAQREESLHDQREKL